MNQPLDFANMPVNPGDIVIDPKGRVWTVAKTEPSIWLRGRAVTCTDKRGTEFHLRQSLIIKVEPEEISDGVDLIKLFWAKSEFTRAARRHELLGRKQRLNTVLIERGMRR